MMELLSKPAARIVSAAILLIAVLLLMWLTVREFNAMIDRAVDLKGSERDSYWTGEIERANAAVNKRAADQVAAAMKIQADTAEKNRADQLTLAQLKVENAQLPKDGSCGLGGDRVGLLPD